VYILEKKKRKKKKKIYRSKTIDHQHLAREKKPLRTHIREREREKRTLIEKSKKKK
jgi:hypothetical protein